MPKLKHCSSAIQARRATTRSQIYRQLQHDGGQSSKSTTRTRLQSSPDSSVLSMPDATSNSTTQQHTPAMEFSTATSTSDISYSLQPQQHAPGLSMATSDSPVLSTRDVSNSLQPTVTQQYTPGLELTTATSHSPVVSMSQSDTAQQVRGQHHTHGPTFRALNYAPHTFNNTTNIGSLTVTCI